MDCAPSSLNYSLYFDTKLVDYVSPLTHGANGGFQLLFVCIFISTYTLDGETVKGLIYG